MNDHIFADNLPVPTLWTTLENKLAMAIWPRTIDNDMAFTQYVRILHHDITWIVFSAEESDRYRRILYYAKGEQEVGVIEFEMRFTGVINPERIVYRMVPEQNLPAHAQLPLYVLKQLSPKAPNRRAEYWRWRCWHHHGLQVPVHVGMGVTYCIGSDRYPLIVTEIPKKVKGIFVSHVSSKMVDGDVYSESQGYVFGNEPAGNQSWYIQPLRRKADAGMNRWRFAGNDAGYYLVGFMDQRRDPSF